MALKVDVIGPENVLFAGASVHLRFSPGTVQAGAVKGLNARNFLISEPILLLLLFFFFFFQNKVKSFTFSAISMSLYFFHYLF